MAESVHALRHKVKSRGFPPNVENLILISKLSKKIASKYDMYELDCGLKDDACGSDKFAEVAPVGVGKDTVEKSRKDTVEEVNEFPALVAAVDFLRWVSWRAVERSREKLACVADLLPHQLPHISYQDHPIPRVFVVAKVRIAVKKTTPETNEKVGYVQAKEMHDIAREETK